MSNSTIIAALKAHAVINYEEGWDFYVECYDADDWNEEVAGCATFEEALRVCARYVALRNDRRADILAERF